MEQVAFRLMGELTKRGVIFKIVTPRPFGPGLDIVRRFDAHASDLPYRGRFGWRDFGSLRKHVSELSEQCSHIWITGTSAAALASVRGIAKPKILSHHYHHFEGNFARIRWRAFYEILCRDVDVITYPTRVTRDEAMSIAPWLKDKARVVPNGIDIDFVDEETRRKRQVEARYDLGISESTFVVGNAGWLIPRKRHDVFLQVAAKVKAQIPDSLFVICGDGPEEPALRRLAAELKLEGAIRFMGWTKDLVPHYRTWDALLFNTDFDTLPSTVMEASAVGCIVVASQLYGGLGEMIDSGRTGYLFSGHDVDAMADALVEISRNPRLTTELRQAAIGKLKSDFPLAKSVNYYSDLFGFQSTVS
jgi:glycosyltransferase involved in cell wall biosynthesis